MKIVFLPETLDYFNELSDLLYEKEIQSGQQSQNHSAGPTTGLTEAP